MRGCRRAPTHHLCHGFPTALPALQELPVTDRPLPPVSSRDASPRALNPQQPPFPSTTPGWVNALSKPAALAPDSPHPPTPLPLCSPVL